MVKVTRAKSVSLRPVRRWAASIERQSCLFVCKHCIHYGYSVCLSEAKGQYSIGVDLTGILRGTHGGTYYKSPAVEAKTHFPTL